MSSSLPPHALLLRSRGCVRAWLRAVSSFVGGLNALTMNVGYTFHLKLLPNAGLSAGYLSVPVTSVLHLYISYDASVSFASASTASTISGDVVLHTHQPGLAAPFFAFDTPLTTFNRAVTHTPLITP